MLLGPSLRAKGEAIQLSLASGLPRALWALAMTVLFACPLAAKAQACSEKWCDEGLAVYMQGHVWPPGAYEFMIEADGEATFCRGEMPLATCGQQVTCDREGVAIDVYGCEQVADLHAFSVISMYRVPEKLAVHIKQEKGWFTSWETVVTPTCSYPNGEQCDERPCCGAKLSMPIEWQYRKDL